MNALRRNTLKALTRYYSEGGGGAQSTPPQSAQASKTVPDVPGLSSNVIQPAVQPVGPGVDPKKTGAYKVPEYFQYDNMSFFEAEIEMASFRCPQPSALKKYSVTGWVMKVKQAAAFCEAASSQTGS